VGGKESSLEEAHVTTGEVLPVGEKRGFFFFLQALIIITHIFSIWGTMQTLWK